MSSTRNTLNLDADAAQRLAIERSQLERFTELYSTLREDRTTTIPDEKLETLGIARGLPLNVDLSRPWPSDDSLQFFNPCGWTLNSLQVESNSGWEDCEWLDLTRWPSDNWLPLQVAMFRSDWLKGRLLSLESIEENIWEPPFREERRARWNCNWEAIKEAIGLELPRWEHIHDTMDRVEYPYRGTWVYFAIAAADKPHAVCTMLDSSTPTEGIAARSEVEAAVKLTEFQHQRACFTHHHTKPILVCTQFDNETARITQAHFDARLDKLDLRQSRLLDLSGLETTPDAWLVLRWMASGAVGRTRY